MFKTNKTIMWMSSALYFLFIIQFLILPCTSTKGKIVTTPLGKIRGYQTTILNGKKYIDAFLAIPYAKPPIKNLRLMNPEPITSWKGIYNATKDSNSCLQIDGDNISGNEDCLYLNIFTPNANKRKKYPVIFFIHGGVYSVGSNDHNILGPDMLLVKNIVLVVINYRLGPLGFASLEDDIIPGNFGLKDQSLALKWVHKYIKYFGGNPSKVTIMGHSAGGASVHYQTLSPMSKGLFKRAIMLSGSVDCPWALDVPGSVKKDTLRLANMLDCNLNNSSSNILKCLQKIPAEKFCLALKQFQMWVGTDPKPVFKPVLESKNVSGSFITKESYFRNTKVPMITGTTSEEGTISTAGYFSARADDFNKTLEEFNENFETLAQYAMLYQNSANDTTDVTKKIRNYFFEYKNISTNELRNLTDMITDALFFEGSIRAIEKNDAPTYVYKFAYYGQYTIPYLMTQNKFRYGVSHSDDLIYLFPLVKLFGINATLSSTDKRISDELVEFYTNFAIYGDPTPHFCINSKTKIKTKWKPTNIKGDFQYLMIDNNGINMTRNYPGERHEFWKNLPWRTKINNWL